MRHECMQSIHEWTPNPAQQHVAMSSRRSFAAEREVKKREKRMKDEEEKHL